MPENEIPPAMRVDIYYAHILLYTAKSYKIVYDFFAIIEKRIRRGEPISSAVALAENIVCSVGDCVLCPNVF